MARYPTVRKTLTIAIAIASVVALAPYLRERLGGRQEAPPRLQTVRICHAWPVGALVVATEALGFYSRHGVVVELQRYAFGAQALAAAFEGKCDLATVAETPVVFASFRRKDFAILASLGTWDDLVKVIARKDHGISSPRDLKGKRFAVLKGTSGDFFLYNLLLSQRMHPEEVDVVYLRDVEAMRKALVTGEIDAMNFWGPPVTEIAEELGDKGIVFSAPGLITIFDSLVAPRATLQIMPEEIRRVLAAMGEAADAVIKTPTDVVRATSKRLQAPSAEVAALLPQMALELDQSLLLALEEEARWAIRGALVDGTKMPNYLDYIDINWLSSVQPKAVTVVR